MPSTFDGFAADTLTLTSRIVLDGPFVYDVSARDSLKLADTPGSGATRTFLVAANDSLAFSSVAGSASQRIISVFAIDTVAFQTAPGSSAAKSHANPTPFDTLLLKDRADVTTSRAVFAADTLTIAASPGINVERLVSARDSMGLTGFIAASSGQTFNRVAQDTLHISSTGRSNQFFDVSVTTHLALTTSSTEAFTPNGAVSAFKLSDAATVSVVLAGGGILPGGDANAGLQVVAYPLVDGSFPMSFAETQDGLILIADGIDPMLRWNGLSGFADTAGVQAPTTPIALAGQNVGTITGYRQAYCRFIDNLGNPSNLSPISNLVNFGRDAFIDDLDINTTTGLVTITSYAHGLKNGEQVIFQDVVGPPINGLQAIGFLDADHFTLQPTPVLVNNWTGTGSWTWGIKTVVYQNIPISTEAKVTRRQLLRNLDGYADVFYVDIDTTDLTSVALGSNRLDDDLSASEAVPLLSDQDFPLANRYSVPPNHKSLVVSHMGRIFAAGDVTITVGNVAPTLGSKVVQGLGTSWRSTFAGRFLYVSGASRPYEIASINEATQAATLTIPYADPTQVYATYAIRSAPGERKLLYFSEPALPEAWPAWNSLAIPEDNDEITGLMVKTSFLYIIERRHIYRFTQQDNPADGLAFLSVNRGCVNNRCYVTADSTTYLLDEAGIYAFDGDQAIEPISVPIQTLFQADGQLGGLSVDWTSNQALWHAAHDAVRDTIRWFVSMVGTGGIYHAICYDYRKRRWWVEEYASIVTSSTTGTIGYRRSLVGTDARRVLCLSEGSLDVVADSTALAGSATAADLTSLTDANASFPTNLSGVPVSITHGTGRDQQNVIIDNTSQSFDVLNDWAVIPDSSSVYQIGGVPWTWRSGWFQILVADEDSNPRDIAITYQPTKNPALLDVQVFLDHSDTPMPWGYDVDQDGVSIITGDPNMTVSLLSRPSRSGWSIQRIAGQSEAYGYGDQFVSVQMSGVQGPEAVRVFQLDISGAEADGGS